VHLLVVQHTFPASHDGGCNAIAHYVHGRPSHIEELIDPEQDGGALEREAEGAQCGREDHERRPGYARDALAGEHEGQHHGDLLTDGELDSRQLRNEHARCGQI
jgi:hypothetical protein